MPAIEPSTTFSPQACRSSSASASNLSLASRTSAHAGFDSNTHGNEVDAGLPRPLDQSIAATRTTDSMKLGAQLVLVGHGREEPA